MNPTTKNLAALRIGLAGAVVGLIAAATGRLDAAPMLASEFSPYYSMANLGNPTGVPGLLGGLTLKAGDPNVLLVGGNANVASGAIYQIGITRDASGHINGFSGPATLFASAGFIDGGLVYGPGGVLFYSGFPNNTIGQIKPGSSAPDKIIDLTPLGVNGTVGALQFAPDGSLKIVSYAGGQGFYGASLVADGTGTYNITSVSLAATLSGGPEGIAYVPPGSPGFTQSSLLLSEYGAGRVSTYNVDANWNPVAGSRRDFITGLTGAEGAFVDPLTGDFLFSTFGSGNEIFVVRGFNAPPTVPEPSSIISAATAALIGLGLAQRRRRARSAA